MQTDSHIEVVSPDRYYAYSGYTERIFCKYESPCQTMINPLAVCYIIIFAISQKFLHTFVITVFKFHHNTTGEM